MQTLTKREEALPENDAKGRECTRTGNCNWSLNAYCCVADEYEDIISQKDIQKEINPISVLFCPAARAIEENGKEGQFHKFRIDFARFGRVYLPQASISHDVTALQS